MWVFRLFGFLPWTIDQSVSLVGTIGWPHAIAIVLLTSLFLFQSKWAELIPRIIRISKDGVDFREEIREQGVELAIASQEEKVDTTKHQEAVLVINEARQLITVEDVKKQFSQIESLDKSNLDKECQIAQSWLMRNGIHNLRDLNALVNSHSLLQTLGDLYVQELKRDPQRPLDPVAISTWGTKLFRLGLREEVVDELRAELRRTPEYIRKHQ